MNGFHMVGHICLYSGNYLILLIKYLLIPCLYSFLLKRGMWCYGDATPDDAKEFGYQQK